MLHRLTAIGHAGLCLLLSLPLRTAQTAEPVSLYRCDLDGRIEFRQTECTAGEQTQQHVVNTSSGLTPSEPGLRLKSTSEKTDTVSKRRRQQVDEQQCWKRRQLLERVERRLRAGYRASEYQRLHDRQREYEAYIHRFCR